MPWKWILKAAVWIGQTEWARKKAKQLKDAALAKLRKRLASIDEVVPASPSDEDEE